jgi:uncharacterized protein YciI
MKSLVLLLTLFALVASLPSVSFAQEKPESKLVQFHMALIKRGPKWQATNTQGSGSSQSDHGKYVMSLLESGKAVIAGPFSDDGEIIGVYVLRAKTAEEARAWVDEDPGVKSGHLAADMLPWWSEDIMKKPSTPMKMTTAYLGFLRRGDKWTPEKTPATEELQKAHIANINRLAETKKLVVAGPFGGNTPLRGIFVFRVESLDEARKLTETDPSVQAGRLAIEMRPWLVPQGILP